MKDLSQNHENIKAESFLSSMMDDISAINLEFQGVFSRNYYNDIIYMDQDTGTSDDNLLNISLSRDSVFHILPEGLFFREDELRKVQKEKNVEKFKALSEKIIKEKQKLLDFFYPFDKTYFKLRFDLERKLNEIIENKTSLLMDELFDIFPVDEKNDFIKRIIPLLPLASEIRSNKMIWRDILKSVFYPAEVEIRIAEKPNTAGLMRGVVKANIYIEKLSNKEFKRVRKAIEPFARFFYEWFIPADMGCEFKVKDKKERFRPGNEMTLDYNTYFN
ncbi:MAG: hypothetical protein LBE79_03405 [Tannerella sp.]|jgi:hypothetical protein|nr:hypothetical protein [Tannerella sp.]